MANLAKQTLRQPGYAARATDAVRPHAEVLSTPTGIVRVFHLPVVKRTSDQPTISLLPTLLIIDGKPALLVQTQTPDEFQESHAYLRDTSGETATATYDQLEKALAAHLQRFNQGDHRYQMALNANGATTNQNGGTWDAILNNMKVKGNDRLRHALPLVPELNPFISALEPIQTVFTPKRASATPELRVADKQAQNWKGLQVVISYSDQRGGIDYVLDRKEGIGVTEASEAVRAFLNDHGAKAGLPLVGEAPPTGGQPPAPLRPHTKLKNALLADPQLTELIAGVAFSVNAIERKRTVDGQPQVKLNSRDGRGGKVPLALIYADEKGLREGPIELKPGADADQTWEQLSAVLPRICAERGIRLLAADDTSGSDADPVTTGAADPPPTPNPPPSPLRQDSDFLRAVEIACRGWEGPIADGVRTLFRAVGTNDKASASKAIANLMTAAKSATTNAAITDLTTRAERAEALAKQHENAYRGNKAFSDQLDKNLKDERETVAQLKKQLEQRAQTTVPEGPNPLQAQVDDLQDQLRKAKDQLKQQESVVTIPVSVLNQHLGMLAPTPTDTTGQGLRSFLEGLRDGNVPKLNEGLRTLTTTAELISQLATDKQQAEQRATDAEATLARLHETPPTPETPDQSAEVQRLYGVVRERNTTIADLQLQLATRPGNLTVSQAKLRRLHYLASDELNALRALAGEKRFSRALKQLRKELHDARTAEAKAKQELTAWSKESRDTELLLQLTKAVTIACTTTNDIQARHDAAETEHQNRMQGWWIALGEDEELLAAILSLLDWLCTFAQQGAPSEVAKSVPAEPTDDAEVTREHELIKEPETEEPPNTVVDLDAVLATLKGIPFQATSPTKSVETNCTNATNNENDRERLRTNVLLPVTKGCDLAALLQLKADQPIDDWQAQMMSAITAAGGYPKGGVESAVLACIRNLRETGVIDNNDQLVQAAITEHRSTWIDHSGRYGQVLIPTSSTQAGTPAKPESPPDSKGTNTPPTNTSLEAQIAAAEAKLVGMLFDATCTVGGFQSTMTPHRKDPKPGASQAKVLLNYKGGARDVAWFYQRVKELPDDQRIEVIADELNETEQFTKRPVTVVRGQLNRFLQAGILDDQGNIHPEALLTVIDRWCQQDVKAREILGLKPRKL